MERCNSTVIISLAFERFFFECSSRAVKLGEKNERKKEGGRLTNRRRKNPW